MTTQDLIKNEDLFSVLGKLRLNKAEVEAMLEADAESDKVYAKLRVVEDLIEILVNTKNRSDYIEDGVVAYDLDDVYNNVEDALIAYYTDDKADAHTLDLIKDIINKEQIQEQKQEKLYSVFNDELCVIDDSRQDQSLTLIGLDSGIEYKIDKGKVLDKFEMTFKDASYVIDWIADNLMLTHEEAEIMYRVQAKLKTEAKWKALFTVLGKLKLNKAEIEAMLEANAESNKVYAKLRIVEDLIKILVNTKNRCDYIEDGVMAYDLDDVYTNVEDALVAYYADDKADTYTLDLIKAIVMDDELMAALSKNEVEHVEPKFTYSVVVYGGYDKAPLIRYQRDYDDKDKALEVYHELEDTFRLEHKIFDNNEEEVIAQEACSAMAIIKCGPYDDEEAISFKSLIDETNLYYDKDYRQIVNYLMANCNL